MDSILQGIFDGQTSADIGLGGFMACIGTALLIGMILAFVYAYKSKYTKSFIATLIILPAIVAIVIIMVNGNIGAGIAVAGAFSLVRFRSVPGNARDIATIFLAMGAGLIVGMGYLAYALIFMVIMGIVMMLIVCLEPACGRRVDRSRCLKITVPEDLEYAAMFREIFDRYAERHELVGLKTTAMGSLFKLTYNVTLKDPLTEREMIDELRVRNGNLEIAMTHDMEVGRNAL